ncbi:MAG: hypothetical protein RIC55_24430 [Pirellulaceae bacterium]
MPSQNKPFWDRPDVAFGYTGVRQVMDTCVFAANAGAVNHLAGRQVWTLGSLIDAGAKEGHWDGGPAIGEIAHEPVKNAIGYVFNTKTNSLLTNQAVREWVDQEGKLVILSRPVQYGGRQGGWHMLTLVAWDSDHYVAWDTGGKMSIVYEDEIERGIPYRNGAVLVPHPNHDAFVYWKTAPNKP